MKIAVTAEESIRIRLRIPNLLIFNRLGFRIFFSSMKKNGYLTVGDEEHPVKIGKLSGTFCREIRKWKQQHGSFTFAEVDTADGTHVLITF